MTERVVRGAVGEMREKERRRRSLTCLKPKISMVDTRRGAPTATHRVRGRALSETRKRIALKYGFKCALCGRIAPDGQVDHKTPLHLGGSDGDENRQWICPDCHSVKSAQEQRGRGE